jgi:hypothetical protein
MFLYCWQWHVAQQYTHRIVACPLHHIVILYAPCPSCSELVVMPLEPGAEIRLINRQTFVIGHSRGVHLRRPFCISFLHPCVWAYRQMRGNYRKMAVCALVQVCTSEIRQSVIQGDWTEFPQPCCTTAKLIGWISGFLKLWGRMGVHKGMVFWNNTLSIRQTDR